MICTEQSLKDQLIEMYRYTFAQARELLGEDDEEEAEDHEDHDFNAGRIVGMHEATSAIFLWAFGGKELYELWTTEVEVPDVVKQLQKAILEGLDKDGGSGDDGADLN